jgi:hypothetical protein
MTPPPTSRYKRRRQLIKRGFQLQVAWLAVLVALAAVLVQAIVSGFFITQEAASLPVDGRALLDVVPGMLWRSVAVSALLLVPMAALLAILASFRIAGPLHSVEQYLRDVARGESRGLCTVRDEDELQELCALVNEALAAVESRKAERGEDPAQAA